MPFHSCSTSSTANHLYILNFAQKVVCMIAFLTSSSPYIFNPVSNLELLKLETNSHSPIDSIFKTRKNDRLICNVLYMEDSYLRRVLDDVLV